MSNPIFCDRFLIKELDTLLQERKISHENATVSQLMHFNIAKKYTLKKYPKQSKATYGVFQLHVFIQMQLLGKSNPWS